MYRYKNVSDFELTVAGVGKVKPGETVTSLFELQHSWLERVEEEKPASKPKKDT